MNQRPKLEKDLISKVALNLIDAGGEKAFSMRKLASVLRVDPMAVYYYHKNKSALVHAVLQSMLEEFEVPEPSGDWQTDIRALCYGMRRLALDHPGTFRIYETYDDWLPAEHRLHEAFHATLLAAGFSPHKTVRSVRLLLTYTESFAVDEISGWLSIGDPDELVDSLRQGAYPTLVRLMDELEDVDADANFDYGLTVLISGLEQQQSL